MKKFLAKYFDFHLIISSLTVKKFISFASHYCEFVAAYFGWLNWLNLHPIVRVTAANYSEFVGANYWVI